MNRWDAFSFSGKAVNFVMQLIPIDIDDSKNEAFKQDQDCADVLGIYPLYYQMIGYSVPWIGYLATKDGKEIVGAGGFKGRPMQNRVEIAYVIFEKHGGKGLGTELCKTLVKLAKTDPNVVVTARTVKEENASVKLLRRTGFLFKGVVHDADDGDVWEWEYI
jgi:[ribosomal protein S5]-alanine N-acetyltransferase